jgi:peptide/nickel transport system permease protein
MEKRRPSVLQELVQERRALISLIVIAVIALLATLGPLVWTIPAEATSPAQALAPPGGAHPLGTDELGRDELARLLRGAQVTLLVGIAAMAAALFLGTLVGAVAGFYRGIADTVLMRVTDGMMAVPAFFLILVVVTVTGSGAATLVLVIAAVSWMPVARVVYGETLRWKATEFVIAAESLGVRRGAILLRHVLPQTVPSLVVSATLGIGYAILTESAISYLGLGIQSPTPSWGNMLQKAQQYVWTSPALALYPGAAITAVVLAFNFLGDGLRDALDPRIRA